MDAMIWKNDYKAFEEKTRLFYAGEISVGDYKGFSGGFGSYAQRGAEASMLRLRMPGGRVNQEKLRFVANAIRKYNIDLLHFTTCQSIQLHNLKCDAVCDLAASALDVGIVTRGGGGDFPRNVMVSPLSGLEEGEYFDVFPYAEKASDFLMQYINGPKFPRKLKVCFSNSPANLPHATFRDLGFVAREDGLFDVYCCGGLGNNPRMGVKVADAVDGSKILYYIQAMVDFFCAYGNYTNRGKARTRYIQETLGDSFIEKFNEKLQAVMESRSDLDLTIDSQCITKSGDGTIEDPRVIAQKQPGLYAVAYHPLGGSPCPQKFVALADAICEMDQVQLHLCPDEGCYIVNLTAAEAKKILALTEDSAKNAFEATVACIGASICQVGVRDSQALLKAIVSHAEAKGFATDLLPQMHISGCPSSCGTHQIGRIGFRGASKKVDGEAQPAFAVFVNGSEIQNNERFGTQIGTMTVAEIPLFIEKLAGMLNASGLAFDDWYEGHAGELETLAAEFA